MPQPRDPLVNPPLFVGIMCGGGGTRLWPTSRQTKPKQLQALITHRSMLTETAARLAGPELTIAGLILITGEAFAVDAASAVSGLDGAGFPEPLIVIEPQGRNTAPCAAAACLAALELHENAIVALLPADHHITNAEGFRAALATAAALAHEGFIVTLGVPPDAPETGFGYVKAGKALSQGFAVDRFVEKPDRATARIYLNEGGYYWNAGVFVTSARVFLDELSRLSPAMSDAVTRAVKLGIRSDKSLLLDAESWAACPPDSIDYAVAEKTDRAAVLPLDVGWSDVGSWSAIWELLEKDTDGNVASGDVMMEATYDCLIRAESRLVATVGLSNVIVIETGDAILIVGKDHVQDIKKIVQRLNDGNRIEARLPSLA